MCVHLTPGKCSIPPAPQPLLEFLTAPFCETIGAHLAKISEVFLTDTPGLKNTNLIFCTDMANLSRVP